VLGKLLGRGRRIEERHAVVGAELDLPARLVIGGKVAQVQRHLHGQPQRHGIHKVEGFADLKRAACEH